MLKKLFFSLIILCSFYSVNIKAAVFSLDINNATQIALKENEDYEIHENDVIKSEAVRKEVQSAFYPQVNGAISWINNFKYPGKDDTSPNNASKAFTKNYHIEYGLNANQVITTFGRILSALRGTKRMELASIEKKQNMELEVVFATKAIYYNVVFAKNMVKIAEKSYTSTKESKDILLEKAYEGRVSKRDNIKIDADIAARIPIISNAETNYNKALEALKTHLGMYFDVEIQLSEGYKNSFPHINRKKAFSLMYENHHLLKALRLVAEGQKYFVQSKKSEYFPVVSAFAKYNYRGMSDDNMFIGNNMINDFGVCGININVPIFFGLKRHQQVRQAKMDEQNALLTYKKIHKQLSLELEKSLLEYEELIKILPSNEEALRLAQKAFDMSQELLKIGQMSVTDLNDAEMMLTGQKIKKETTIFQLNMALAKIELLLGESYYND